MNIDSTVAFTKYFKSVVWSILALGAVLSVAVTYYSLPPTDFAPPATVIIKPGTYLSQAADILAQAHVVKSPFLFKVYVMVASGHRQVLAGEYLFDEPQSAVKVAYRLANGVQGLPMIKITLTEGLTTNDIGNIIKKNIPNFDLQTFTALAKPYEGTLFPDTYYLYDNSTPAAVTTMLRDTFTIKVKPLLLDVQSSGHSLGDIVTMASIVEREATSTVDRRIIAGILWKRISKNMPLQVDPPFYYILGKDSAQLTLADLAMDSPYNLYKHTGLPPTPIDNPGLDAIEATVHPTLSDYFFYLSGKDGRMHYAVTLAGHVANRTKYMR